MNEPNVKTFPIKLTKKKLDRIGRAVLSSSFETKHDLITKAVDEKLNEILGPEREED